MPKTASEQPTPPAVDVCTLQDGHPDIRAADWRSPLICKLLRGADYIDGTKTVSASHRAKDGSVLVQDLVLAWAGIREDYRQCVNTYQDPVLTEHGTLGLACILLSCNTTLRIAEVTRRGEVVDYWIGDDEKRKRFVLEVGGLTDGSIDRLAREKSEQLQRNPWHRDGYACVAVYDADEARLWFCHHGTRV